MACWLLVLYRGLLTVGSVPQSAVDDVYHTISALPPLKGFTFKLVIVGGEVVVINVEEMD